MLLAVSIQLAPYGVSTVSAIVPALAFALIITAVGTMFGLFRGGERRPLQVVFSRTLLALAVGVPICYVVFGAFPQTGEPRAPYSVVARSDIRAAPDRTAELARGGAGRQRRIK